MKDEGDPRELGKTWCHEFSTSLKKRRGNDYNVLDIAK